MKTKTTRNTLLSILLCLVLLVGILPTMAFAAGGGEGPMKHISSIEMTVPAPTAGSNVSASIPTTSEDAKYYTSELGNDWFSVLASGDSHISNPYSSEIVFEDNKWYMLSTSVYADPGCYFDENTTITVNGDANEAVIFRLNNYYSPYSNEALIHAWFKVGEPATATTVDSISVTDLPETTEKTKCEEWKAEILTKLKSQTGSLPGIAMVDADLYSMCHTEIGYGYTFQGSRWRPVSNNDNVSDDVDYGLLLTFYQDDTTIFSKSITVTVNEKEAEVIYIDDDFITAFLPIGTKTAVIEKVDLVVRRNIIEDDTIPRFSEAFEVAGYYDKVYTYFLSSIYATDLCPFTIKNAEIKDRNLNTVTPGEKFNYNTNYWLIADLEAKPGTKFASTVTGSFGGTSDDLRITPFSDTKIGIARLVSSYECVRTNISSATSGVIIRFPQPAPDVSYARGKIYQYGDAGCSVDCYEVPYIGCSMITDKMNPGDKYEAGKIYRADFTVTANKDFRLGETFVPTLYHYTGDSTSEILKYDLMKVTESTPTRYKFFLWFTCGDVPEITTIRNTTINITGPELPTEEDLTFELKGENCVIDGDHPVILAEVNSWNRNGELDLSFQLGPESGYAFGRNITVNYNETPLSVIVNNPNSFRYAYINLMPGGYKVKIVGELNVAGKVGTQYSGTESFKLELNGKNLFRDVEVNNDVTEWITNIPQGMSAKIKKLEYTDKYEDEICAIEIAFEGKPEESRVAPISVILPADKQYRSETALTAATNGNVKFNITAHEGDHNYDKTQWSYKGADGHAHCCTIDGCTEHDDIEAHTPNHEKATEEAAQTCTVCGYEIAPKLEHAPMLVPGYPPTTDKPGKKDYYHCDNCGRNYEDPTSNNLIEDDIDEWSFIPMLPNNGGSGRHSVATFSIETADSQNGSITVSPISASKDTAVTITVAPDKGYKLDKLTVMDKDGKSIKLSESDGKYIFNMPASKVTVEASFTKLTALNPFIDVNVGDYFYDAVLWAVDKDITSGTSATTFSPNEPCTRAQIVTFLWRAAGSPEAKNAASFADVNADSYYAKAVAWAVEQGITNGTSDTIFSPDEPCTRAQAITFLSRALKGNSAGGTSFTDVEPDSYYAKAVEWAVNNGISNGTSDTTFSPDDDCTRAQIVTLLFRAMNK